MLKKDKYIYEKGYISKYKNTSLEFVRHELDEYKGKKPWSSNMPFLILDMQGGPTSLKIDLDRYK